MVLSKNCRNTLQIAVTSNNIIDINAKWNDNIVSGDMPQIIFAKDKDLKIEQNNDCREESLYFPFLHIMYLYFEEIE